MSIEVCTAKNCPIKDTCYRYKTIAVNISQTWIKPEWDGKYCKNYIDFDNMD